MTKSYYALLCGTMHGRISVATERPETLEVGSNVLAGTAPVKIQECTASMLERATEWASPFGDGTAGERILGILKQHLER